MVSDEPDPIPHDGRTASQAELVKQADEMFCSSCHAVIKREAEICIHCGVRVRHQTAGVKGLAEQPDEMFCPSCGTVIKRAAELCINCGVRVGRPRAFAKSKTISILLAVFFSFFTWLYTYREDGRKFWIGLAVSLVFWPAIWIWAIIDTISKGADWYDFY